MFFFLSFALFLSRKHPSSQSAKATSLFILFPFISRLCEWVSFAIYVPVCPYTTQNIIWEPYIIFQIAYIFFLLFFLPGRRGFFSSLTRRSSQAVHVNNFTLSQERREKNIIKMSTHTQKKSGSLQSVQYMAQQQRFCSLVFSLLAFAAVVVCRCVCIFLFFSPFDIPIFSPFFTALLFSSPFTSSKGKKVCYISNARKCVGVETLGYDDHHHDSFGWRWKKDIFFFSKNGITHCTV